MDSIKEIWDAVDKTFTGGDKAFRLPTHTHAVLVLAGVIQQGVMVFKEQSEKLVTAAWGHNP